MNAGAIIGIIIGLIGFGVGIGFALYALGFFQYLGGKKRSNIPPVSREALFSSILSLNDPSKPYRFSQGKETDIIADWKYVDAKWCGILNKSGLKQTYRAMLFLDASRHTVRCFESSRSVSWKAGLQGTDPSFESTSSRFGGSILFKKSRGVGYGFKDLKGGSPGKVYDFSFDVDDIREPVKDIVLKSGWEWVPVTVKRHARYSKGQTVPPQVQNITNFCMTCGNRLPEGASSCPKCRDAGRA